jgi:hypothetical protein
VRDALGIRGDNLVTQGNQMPDFTYVEDRSIFNNTDYDLAMSVLLVEPERKVGNILGPEGSTGF